MLTQANKRGDLCIRLWKLNDLLLFKVTLDHSGHLPLNNLFLQKRGVSKFIRDSFGKYSDTVASLRQDKQLLWAFPLSIKKSEYRVTFHFHSYSKEVFQNPFGFCSENIWTVPSNLKSNNLDEPRFPLVLKKDWINGKPYCFILLQERCSEKRSENGEIHSGISE